MQTFEIKVPDEKTPLIKALLKELGVSIRVTKEKEPNSDTLAAMEELKKGRGKRFDSAEEMFSSI